jgi:predicted amidophosphoribosyltransferase
MEERAMTGGERAVEEDDDTDFGDSVCPECGAEIENWVCQRCEEEDDEPLY